LQRLGEPRSASGPDLATALVDFAENQTPHGPVYVAN
jgi:hypothetical protein